MDVPNGWISMDIPGLLVVLCPQDMLMSLSDAGFHSTVL